MKDFDWGMCMQRLCLQFCNPSPFFRGRVRKGGRKTRTRLRTNMRLHKPLQFPIFLRTSIGVCVCSAYACNSEIPPHFFGGGLGRGSAKRERDWERVCAWHNAFPILVLKFVIILQIREASPPRWYMPPFQGLEWYGWWWIFNRKERRGAQDCVNIFRHVLGVDV